MCIESNLLQEVKLKSKARARKDRGVFKKPIAAVLTRLEVENGQELIKQKEKVPLQDIDSIRYRKPTLYGDFLSYYSWDMVTWSSTGCPTKLDLEVQKRQTSF